MIPHYEKRGVIMRKVGHNGVHNGVKILIIGSKKSFLTLLSKGTGNLGNQDSQEFLPDFLIISIIVAKNLVRIFCVCVIF